MVKKIYKYGTGMEVPEGAEFLSTVVENKILIGPKEFRFVWHYFLVEVAE